MSRDYFVLWTRDLPTPSALGLGTPLLPWPSPESAWPRTAQEREQLGYPGRPQSNGDLALMHSRSEPEGELPEEVVTALDGRGVVRVITIQNDDALATTLAEAGEGVCFDEEESVLFPEEDGPGRSTDDPSRALRAAAAKLWVGMNPRPGAACGRLVDAAASGDSTAIAVLHAWAPDPYTFPNLGVRHMKHDRHLCELVFEAAKKRPTGLAALLEILSAHRYFPAARRPELAELATQAGVDVDYFVSQARRDAAERRRWFQMDEPAD